MVSLFCALGLTPALIGSTFPFPATFTLGTDHNQVFNSENVGPYYGTLNGSSAAGFFCLDDTLTAYFGASYAGTANVPTTQQEEEAAFLASYALYLGSPSSNSGIVKSVEGPISFAIWQIMGTLGSTPPDPAAQPFIQTAEFAYYHNLISQAYLSKVLIFSPSDTNIQRFITAVPDGAEVSSAVPEPESIALAAAGLGVGLALARRRLRRPPPAGR